MNNFDVVDSVLDVTMMTPHGHFLAAAFNVVDEHERFSEHFCLYKNVKSGDCLLRLNSACLTSEVFGCSRCDCAWQLEATLQMFRDVDSCALVYTTTHEGRGQGITSKLKGYLGSDGTPSSGLDGRYRATPDVRDFGAPAFVARSLGIKSVRLLSDNPAKRNALHVAGISVVEVVGLRSQDPRFSTFYRLKDELASSGYAEAKVVA